MVNLQTRFDSISGTWTLCPKGRNPGYHSIKRKPIPSIHALELLGHDGVMEMDKCLRSYAEARRYICGYAGVARQEYFINNVKNGGPRRYPFYNPYYNPYIHEQNIAELFKNNILLICGFYNQEKCFDDTKNREKRLGANKALKANNWDWNEYDRNDLKDRYFIHTTKDMNPKYSRGGPCVRYVYKHKEIAKGCKKAIREVLEGGISFDY